MSAVDSDIIFGSYNVHGCVGADGRRDPDRVAAVIEQLAADVVGLQEVECRERGGCGGDQLARLAERTGMKAIPGPTIREATGYFGNALLTRHPVVEVIHTDLSFRQREPRGMMDVRLRIGRAIVRVLVTHFGLRAQERRHQADVVLKLLQGEDVTGKPHAFDVLVLLGDFNEWHPRSITLLRLHEAFGRTPHVRTFPSRWPVFALDRVWVSPRESLKSVGVLKTGEARAASDHLPLWARLDLRGRETEIKYNCNNSDAAEF